MLWTVTRPKLRLEHFSLELEPAGSSLKPVIVPPPSNHRTPINAETPSQALHDPACIGRLSPSRPRFCSH